MRKKRAALAAAGAATASIALVAAVTVSANAAGPYVIKAGTQTSGTVAATANTIGTSPQVSFTDATSGTSLSCGSASANATIKLGTNATGKGIGTITASQFNNCTGPLGLALTVTQTKNWSLDATGPVAANGNKVPGRISGVGAHVSAANASQCSFDVSGSVVNGGFFQLPKTNQQLRLTGTAATLTISNVQGCFGLVNSGDKANFKATFKVTNPVGPISIANG